MSGGEPAIADGLVLRLGPLDATMSAALDELK